MDAFIIQCIQNVKQNPSLNDNDVSIMSSSTVDTSFLQDYLKHNNESDNGYSAISPSDIDNLLVPSLCSDTITFSVLEDDDEKSSEFSEKSTKSKNH